MSAHPNSKLIVHYGEPIDLQLWSNENGSDSRKLWISKDSFFTVVAGGNTVMHGNIAAAVTNLDEETAAFVVDLFQSSGLSVGEWKKKIGSDYNLEMKG